MGDAASDEPRDLVAVDDVIEVLEPNWETVQVFKASSWVVHILTDGKILHQDITNQEILSTCLLLGYKRANWQRILLGITTIMVPAARQYLNNRTQENKPHRIKPSG